jgi:hypothetical protein
MSNSNQPAGYKVVIKSKLNPYADPETHYFLLRDYLDARKEARGFRQKMAKNENLKVTCVRYY